MKSKTKKIVLFSLAIVAMLVSINYVVYWCSGINMLKDAILAITTEELEDNTSLTAGVIDKVSVDDTEDSHNKSIAGVTSIMDSANYETPTVTAMANNIIAVSAAQEQARQEAEKVTAPVVEGSEPYDGSITAYTNLANRMEITTDQMNKLINHFAPSSSPFRGKGQAFIDASKATGYDPIFLLALAGVESGWSVSSLHSGKNNPYSINMTDENPSGGYTMGETFYDGIVNGGIWIHKNFYEYGEKNLHDMIYGKKQYCSTGDSWINSIVYIMDTSYRML